MPIAESGAATVATLGHGVTRSPAVLFPEIAATTPAVLAFVALPSNLFGALRLDLWRDIGTSAVLSPAGCVLRPSARSARTGGFSTPTRAVVRLRPVRRIRRARSRASASLKSGANAD
jgi:hypothetical protein